MLSPSTRSIPGITKQRLLAHAGHLPPSPCTPIGSHSHSRRSHTVLHPCPYVSLAPARLIDLPINSTAATHRKPTLCVPVSVPMTLTKNSQDSDGNPHDQGRRANLRRPKRPPDPFRALFDTLVPQIQLPRTARSSDKRYRLSDVPCGSARQLDREESCLDPLLTVLARFQRTGKVFYSKQVMRQAMRQLVIHASCSQPSRPLQASTSKSPQPPSSHFPRAPPLQSAGLASEGLSRPDNLEAAWSEIYLEYLRSSSGPQEFARRLRNLINKRLPRRLSEQIISSHGLDPSLAHLISTGSYNELIAFYYRSNKYHQARRLLREMNERGFEKELQTHELISTSYQALNKFRGVELTLAVIERLGQQISPHCWTSLFSIRPRRPETLHHHDSMDQTPALATADSRMTREPQWMSINKFLDGWMWGAARLHGDGWALVSLTKRLMATGKWDTACKLVGVALSLDAIRRSAVTPGPSRLALSPYWATSLLNALVFGLYNSKQSFKQATKARRLQATRPGFTASTQGRHTLTKSPDHQEPPLRRMAHSSRQRPLLAFARIACVFEFVDSFLKKHPHHHIQVSTSLLLNCLRIQTCLAPSDVQALLHKWTQEHGLRQREMGSRLGIRLAHVMSVWMTSVMHELQVAAGKRSAEANEPGSSARASGSSPETLARLLTEHRTLLNLWRGEGSEPGLAQMILRGPVDGQLIRGPSSFYSAQCFGSIKVAMKRLSKLHKKLVQLQAGELGGLAMSTGGEEDPFGRFLEQVRRLSDGKEGNGRAAERWADGLIVEETLGKATTRTQSMEERIRTLYRWHPERPDIPPIPLKAKLH